MIEVIPAAPNCAAELTYWGANIVRAPKSINPCQKRCDAPHAACQEGQEKLVNPKPRRTMKQEILSDCPNQSYNSCKCLKQSTQKLTSHQFCRTGVICFYGERAKASQV